MTPRTSTGIPQGRPTEYQGNGQYYAVLNRFFTHGERVTVAARCIGKHRSKRVELCTGLALDRAQFLSGWNLWQVGARCDELVKDGCDIRTYTKPDPPGGMCTYILVFWPSNAELEQKRALRVSAKRAAQPPLLAGLLADNEKHPVESDYMRRVREEQARYAPLFAGVR
jgi:hypothetical protein